MSGETDGKSRGQRANLLVGGACLAVFCGMVGMAYAAVPLYKMFCQVTGYGGTTQRVEQYASRVIDRTITVRFDANISDGLPWDFKPDQREVTTRIGETTEARFHAINLFDRPTTGRAAYNVVPESAGAYFNKVQCFCFDDATMKANESREMPVVFYVDPAIDDVPELKGLKSITLSYTFFPVDDAKPVAVAPEAEGDKTDTSTDEKLGG